MIAKPSPWARLKAAVQFYQNGWQRFNLQPRPVQSTKKIPFIWPQWYNGQPQWQLINYEAYANEGYNANAVIYSAIMYKTRAITIAPLRAYTGTMEEPELLPPDHPLQALCMRPNRFQSWAEFQGLAEVYLNLSGNCYVVLERQAGQVIGMYLLRPDCVFIIPAANKQQLIGFWYVPEGLAWQDGRPYLPQDVIHIKLPNPLDPLDGLGYGVSPLSPAAHSGDVDNDLTKFLRLFFKAGAMPSGLLSFETPLMDEEVDAARRRWKEIYGGYEHWADNDVAVLGQGGKYQRIGFSFQEMDVSKLDARNESRIAAPFGVPLTLIESRPEIVSSTYNNKQTDRLMFWQDTMIPELKWFETEYQYYLQGDGGEFVMFDLSGVPALTMAQDVRIDKFQKAFETSAVTADELRAELGLGPLPEPIEPEVIEPTPEPEQDDDMDDAPEAEEQAEEAEDNLKRVLAIISDNDRKARQRRASLNWQNVLGEIGGGNDEVKGIIRQGMKEQWSVKAVMNRLEALGR